MPSQSPFRCALARNHKWYYPIGQPVWSLPETREENAKRNHYCNRSSRIGRGKYWAPTYLNTERSPVSFTIIYDHYRKFPIIRKQAGTSSLAIMNHVKSIFPLPAHNRQWATIQLPRVRQLKETYGIEHVTSSSLFLQSNGFAERMVQTVKNTLRRKSRGSIHWNTV